MSLARQSKPYAKTSNPMQIKSFSLLAIIVIADKLSPACEINPASRAASKANMTESNLKAAKAILDQQGEAKKWGQTEHLYMLAAIAVAAIAEEQGMDADEIKAAKAAVRKALTDDGVAGNASQFRQGLVKAKLIPASAESLAAYE